MWRLITEFKVKAALCFRRFCGVEYKSVMYQECLCVLFIYLFHFLTLSKLQNMYTWWNYKYFTNVTSCNLITSVKMRLAWLLHLHGWRRNVEYELQSLNCKTHTQTISIFFTISTKAVPVDFCVYRKLTLIPCTTYSHINSQYYKSVNITRVWVKSGRVGGARHRWWGDEIPSLHFTCSSFRNPHGTKQAQWPHR